MYCQIYACRITTKTLSYFTKMIVTILVQVNTKAGKAGGIIEDVQTVFLSFRIPRSGMRNPLYANQDSSSDFPSTSSGQASESEGQRPGMSFQTHLSICHFESRCNRERNPLCDNQDSSSDFPSTSSGQASEVGMTKTGHVLSNPPSHLSFPNPAKRDEKSFVHQSRFLFRLSFDKLRTSIGIGRTKTHSVIPNPVKRDPE
jgi:hypothetical protein